jgi:hypothetical protein
LTLPKNNEYSSYLLGQWVYGRLQDPPSHLDFIKNDYNSKIHDHFLKL